MKILEVLEIGFPQSIVQFEGESVTSLVKTEELSDLINKQLDFTFVSEQEPPHQVDLLVKAPNGLIHIANWRPAYNIFTCQDKPESSYDWSWKLI
jgi:hypothetical protein